MKEREKQVNMLLSIKSMKEISNFTLLWLKVTLYFGYFSHPILLLLLIILINSDVSFDYVAYLSYFSYALANLFEAQSTCILIMKLKPVLQTFIFENDKLIKDGIGQKLKLKDENRRVKVFIYLAKLNLIQTSVCGVACGIYVVVGMPKQYILNNSLYLLVGFSFLQKEILYLKSFSMQRVNPTSRNKKESS